MLWNVWSGLSLIVVRHHQRCFTMLDGSVTTMIFSSSPLSFVPTPVLSCYREILCFFMLRFLAIVVPFDLFSNHDIIIHKNEGY